VAIGALVSTSFETESRRSGTPPAASPEAAPALLISGLFVVLWSTGFIGAKLGLPHAEPLTFLLWRYAGVVLVLLPLCWLAGARWPASLAEAGHVAVAGVLMQAGYLGGVFCAMHLGLPAGVAALVVGLQPILTAVLGERMVAERTNARQWLGLALGFAGVAAVVWNKMSAGIIGWASLALILLALVSITLGTLYQKRHCAHVDIRSNAAIQFLAAFVVVLPLAWSLETMQVRWNPELVLAIVWLVFGLSIGAVFLLFALIRRGAATSVASLMYLVPPSTAIFAWLLFGEAYTLWAALGMALSAAGVWIVTREQARLAALPA
jgi:drug/metabolite transporter (DMT)-like permease